MAGNPEILYTCRVCVLKYLVESDSADSERERKFLASYFTYWGNMKIVLRAK